MALKATIYKASLQISDMDRQVYAEHVLTLALHPSETEERLVIRLLAYALQVPPNQDFGALQFARGMSDVDEPDVWQHDLSGQLVQWIEVGQPDERRLAKACGRAARVSIYAYASSAPIWWAAIRNKVLRQKNLAIWQIQPDQSQALAGLAQRAMQWQVTVQDGTVWVSSDGVAVELTPQRLEN